MSCHGCAEPFGFWRKEISCPKCHFSFCKKCLRFSLSDFVSKESPDAKLIVCLKCYREAESSLSSANTQDPLKLSNWEKVADVVTAIEVLEALDNPVKPPITVYREPPRVSALKKGLSVEDQNIVDRLEDLRNFTNRRKSEPPEEEVAARLAKLKDEQYESGRDSKKRIEFNYKNETEEELLKRLQTEAQIDKSYKHNLVDDIEKRLANLKSGSNIKESESGGGYGTGGIITVSNPSTQFSDLEKSESEQVEDIINRYKAEVELESKMPNDAAGSDDEESSSREPPVQISDEEDIDVDQLCRICDEKRATIMCKECDQDIYCRKCFKEFHDEIGESHKPYPARFPK